MKIAENNLSPDLYDLRLRKRPKHESKELNTTW